VEEYRALARNAHDAGFRQLVSQPVWAAFPSMPALHETAREGGYFA